MNQPTSKQEAGLSGPAREPEHPTTVSRTVHQASDRWSLV